MPRVKRGVTARARHKKVLVQAKGYRGRRKNVYRIAKQAVMKAGQYAVPRPSSAQASVPFPVDRPYQCRCP
jgi:ribosomal protein L20